MAVRIRMQICGFVFTIFAPGFLVVYTFLPQGNLIYSKSNFVQCVYHLTMNGRSKTLVLVLSLTKFMWPPLIDWNDCLFAGFWCGTLEEFVGPNWDEITLNDALQAYAISDIWWEICHEKVGLRWTVRFWTVQGNACDQEVCGFCHDVWLAI